MLVTKKKIIDFMIIEKEQHSKNVITVSERGKYAIILFYGICLFLSSFFFNHPSEIMRGMTKIILAPSLLITDYIELANMGAAFFNSGFLMILFLIIAKINKVHMSGPVVAAIFLVAGFGFFGKNIYNVWSILFGTYLFSMTQVDNFSKYIVLAFFGTALAPVVSQISFGLGFNPVLGIIVGNMVGVLIGLIIIPLANHFVTFHQGFNLYNMGFTAGIVGTVLMSLLRAFGYNNEPTMILSEGNNSFLAVYFGLGFLSMIIIGYLLNGESFTGYKKLLKASGRLVSDFISVNGFGISLINMGILGFVAIFYVLIVGGQLSGIVIGGVMAVAGFATFGKHIRNVIPIILGVYIASLFKIGDAHTVTYLIAALFGTALAPVAGMFGWKAGILAGFLHTSVVMSLGYLHGGMNLYNNGFSCGIVAALLIPLIETFRKDEN